MCFSKETELSEEDIEVVNQNDQWLKLVAEDKTELDKAKVIFRFNVDKYF